MKAFVSYFFARKKSFVTTYQPLVPFVRIYATGSPVAFLFVYALKFNAAVKASQFLILASWNI